MLYLAIFWSGYTRLRQCTMYCSMTRTTVSLLVGHTVAAMGCASNNLSIERIIHSVCSFAEERGA